MGWYQDAVQGFNALSPLLQFLTELLALLAVAIPTWVTWKGFSRKKVSKQAAMRGRGRRSSSRSKQLGVGGTPAMDQRSAKPSSSGVNSSPADSIVPQHTNTNTNTNTVVINNHPPVYPSEFYNRLYGVDLRDHIHRAPRSKTKALSTSPIASGSVASAQQIEKANTASTNSEKPVSDNLSAIAFDEGGARQFTDDALGTPYASHSPADAGAVGTEATSYRTSGSQDTTGLSDSATMDTAESSLAILDEYPAGDHRNGGESIEEADSVSEPVEPVSEEATPSASQTTDTAPVSAGVALPVQEVASPSGRLLVPQEFVQRQREQIANLRQALRYASFFFQECQAMVVNYKRTSKTTTPFQNDIRVLGVISDYLVNTRDLLSPLNTALNKLNFDWPEYDPRSVFFAFPDVFRLADSQPTDDWTPDGLKWYFKDALMLIVQAVEGQNFEVRRKIYLDTRDHSNRKWVYVIPRMTSDTYDQADASMDNLEGVSEDDATEETDEITQTE